MTDDTPDYTKLSGAEFARAVGADPEKWAAAFRQAMRVEGYHRMPVAQVDKWFADAMAAARAEGQRLGRIGEGK